VGSGIYQAEWFDYFGIAAALSDAKHPSKTVKPGKRCLPTAKVCAASIYRTCSPAMASVSRDYIASLAPFFLISPNSVLKSQPSLTCRAGAGAGSGGVDGCSLCWGKDPIPAKIERPMHWALRLPAERICEVDGKDITGQVHAQTAANGEDSHADSWPAMARCYRGSDYDVVNIGVGGSDLGPLMVTQALDRFAAA